MRYLEERAPPRQPGLFKKKVLCKKGNEPVEFSGTMIIGKDFILFTRAPRGIRWRAARALRGIGEPAVGSLILALKSRMVSQGQRGPGA